MNSSPHVTPPDLNIEPPAPIDLFPFLKLRSGPPPKTQDEMYNGDDLPRIRHK